MRTTELEPDAVRETVREFYETVGKEERGCGCAPTCCAATTETQPKGVDAAAHAIGYSQDETAAVPDGSNLGLGCGNPLVIASLQPGQTVLDLGSGAGFDAFLAAKAVGTGGRVIGVDMTPAMITKARRNKARGSYAHVEFRLGEIENLPVADNSVDVVISNCVINLSPDKRRVFVEAFRVLKPGGRLAISDIVATAPIPGGIRRDLELLAGCVAGAASVSELERYLAEAGFSDVRITLKSGSRDYIRDCFPGRGIEDYVASATIEAIKR